MAKSKFILSSDLVKIEPEPHTTIDNANVVKTAPIKREVEKEHLSFKIPKTLKYDFQIWCVKNKKNMTSVIENMILEMLKKNS
jgi:hypothetical protein